MHPSNVCIDCWEQHLHSELERKAWDKLTCPDCEKILTIPEIHKIDRLSTKKVEPLIMEKATLAYLKTDPDCVDCPSGSCKSGSSMADGHIFTCGECKYRYCFSCNVQMHEDESCTEYKDRDSRDKEKVEDKNLSTAEVHKVSKPCPECHSRLDKYIGCDHVTCSQCRHEFCWICFASYLGPDGIHLRGNGSHEESCMYHPARLPNYQAPAEPVRRPDPYLLPPLPIPPPVTQRPTVAQRRRTTSTFRATARSRTTTKSRPPVMTGERQRRGHR